MRGNVMEIQRTAGPNKKKEKTHSWITMRYCIKSYRVKWSLLRNNLKQWKSLHKQNQRQVGAVILAAAYVWSLFTIQREFTFSETQTCAAARCQTRSHLLTGGVLWRGARLSWWGQSSALHPVTFLSFFYTETNKDRGGSKSAWWWVVWGNLTHFLSLCNLWCNLHKCTTYLMSVTKKL